MKYIFFVLLLLSFVALRSPTSFAAGDYPNAVYMGMGLGQNISASHTEFSFIAGYDKYISGTPEFTVGVLLEGVFSEHSSFVLGLPIGFYPTEVLKLWLAPCYSFGGSEKEYYTSEEDNVEYFKNANEFTLKFGIGYNYHFQNSRWSVLPFLEGSVVGSEFVLGFGAKFNLYFTNDFQ